MFEKISTFVSNNKQAILSKGPVILGAVLGVTAVVVTLIIADRNAGDMVEEIAADAVEVIEM